MAGPGHKVSANTISENAVVNLIWQKLAQVMSKSKLSIHYAPKSVAKLTSNSLKIKNKNSSSLC